MAEGTDFLYPFIEGDERDAGALLVDLASSVEAKVATGAELRDATYARIAPDLAGTVASYRAGYLASSPAATAAAPRTHSRWRPCSAVLPPDARSPPGAWRMTRRCSPRSPTMSASTSFSPDS